MSLREEVRKIHPPRYLRELVAKQAITHLDNLAAQGRLDPKQFEAEARKQIHTHIHQKTPRMKQILHLTAQGYTPKMIEVELSCGMAYIYKILHQNGVTPVTNKELRTHTFKPEDHFPSTLLSTIDVSEDVLHDEED